jgi:hypothetical protein
MKVMDKTAEISTRLRRLNVDLIKENDKARVVGFKSWFDEDLAQKHACRQLDHTPAKSFATETKKGGVRSTPDCLFGSIVTQDLYEVCGNFVLLQQMRHDADYDLARKFRREEAIDCYNRAVKTIKAIDKLKKTEPLLLQSFVLALVFNPKVRKR